MTYTTTTRTNKKNYLTIIVFPQPVQLNPNQIIVMLLPSRTDVKWFHDYVYHKPNVETIFLKGRLLFENTPYPAPFPSMVVILASLSFHSVKIQQCKSALTLSNTISPAANPSLSKP
jgi:hypothetical protein